MKSKLIFVELLLILLNINNKSYEAEMKYLVILFFFLSFSFTLAQQDSSKVNSPSITHDNSIADKIYYGGGIGFNFWGDYFRIAVEPMVGYKITPKLSAGAKLMYEYIKYSTELETTYNNFGGSVFSRYRVVPQFYVHAEFAYYSYQYSTKILNTTYDSEREWVPFLLLGGGYSQQIGPNVVAYAQALWDVIQDDKSPYSASEPWVSVGVGVGF